MLCNPIVAPRRPAAAACTVPAVSAELSRQMAAYQAMTQSAASGAETMPDAPATSESTAAAPIAAATTRARPKRCAVSLPVIDTTMPARLAAVKIAVGPGSQGGAPCRAMTAARKVTAQARSAAISQV